jgi:hypothetical protein
MRVRSWDAPMLVKVGGATCLKGVISGSRGAADTSWTLGIPQPADRLSRGPLPGARSGAALA